MKIYAKRSSTLYKFVPKSGRTDYNSLKFAFDFLKEGDYVINNKGVIYEVLDPGHLHAGFLEAFRTIEVKEVSYNILPQEVKDAIYRLANGYPASEICRKVLQQG